MEHSTSSTVEDIAMKESRSVLQIFACCSTRSGGRNQGLLKQENIEKNILFNSAAYTLSLFGEIYHVLHDQQKKVKTIANVIISKKLISALCSGKGECNILILLFIL